MKDINVIELTPDRFDEISKEFDMPMISREAFGASSTVAGERDGQVLMVGGVVPFLPGVGEFWMAPNMKTPPTATELYRVATEVVRSFSKGFHRLQMKTKATETWSETWPTHLGFQKECTMRKYGPDGEDFHLFAFFPEEDE